MALNDRQSRAVKVAWNLEALFSTKHGYAFASNAHLAAETGLTERNVQKGLATLEEHGAVVRGTVIWNGRPSRAIWPGKRVLRLAGTSVTDVGGGRPSNGHP